MKNRCLVLVSLEFNEDYMNVSSVSHQRYNKIIKDLENLSESRSVATFTPMRDGMLKFSNMFPDNG